MPDCHVALLTPPGRGAIATVVVQGLDAAAHVGQHFQTASTRPLGEAPLGRIVFGRWLSSVASQSERTNAEELVVCRTADDQVEVHCHGGLAASRAIIAALTSSGCRQLDWRDWIEAGSVDPIAAAAHVSLAEAPTRRAAEVLLDQYHGRLREELEQIIQLCDTQSHRQVAERIAVLQSRLALGLHLCRPWKVVLAGRPNVGKSSLLNAIVGYTRAIVFDEAGTTRDVVSARTAIDGWPVELSDTAGLRAGGEEVEQQGVERARRAAAAADLLVLVFDASEPWREDDRNLADEYSEALVVINKCDLVASAGGNRPEGIAVSALTGEAVPSLVDIIGRRLVPGPPPPGAAVPFTEPQGRAIRLAAEAAAAGELLQAAEVLNELLADADRR